MVYTALFQNSDGSIMATHHVESNNRNEAWISIYNSRLDMSACLIALIDGDHIVNLHGDLFTDEQS